MEGIGGIPWVFIHLGWVVFGGVLVYAVLRNRGRLGWREKAAQQERVRENFRRDEDAA